jgi:hypothetical protein
MSSSAIDGRQCTIYGRRATRRGGRSQSLSHATALVLVGWVLNYSAKSSGRWSSFPFGERISTGSKSAISPNNPPKLQARARYFPEGDAPREGIRYWEDVI